MLMRFDPFREFDTVAQMHGRQSGGRREASMPMDAYRSGDRFIVHFDLPGVDPGSIDLTVEKNVLTVHAERRRAEAEGLEMLVAERPHGTFSRQLFLGETLDTDRIAAQYRDGVLTLRIPIAERKEWLTQPSTPSPSIPSGPTDATCTPSGLVSRRKRLRHCARSAGRRACTSSSSADLLPLINWTIPWYRRSPKVRMTSTASQARRESWP